MPAEAGPSLAVTDIGTDRTGTETTSPASKAGFRPFVAIGLGVVLLGAAVLVFHPWREQTGTPADRARVVVRTPVRPLLPPRPLGPVPARPGAASPSPSAMPGVGATPGASEADKADLPGAVAGQGISGPGANAGQPSASRGGAGEAAAAPKPAKEPPGIIRMAAAGTVPAQDWKVRHVYPDGLVLESPDGAALRKVKFTELPEAVRQQFQFDPQRAAEYQVQQARAAAEYRAEQTRAEAEFRAQQARTEAENRAEMSRKAAELRASEQIAARPDAEQVREKVALLTQIVSDYHKSHTYLMEDRFVCADMACDVWNMVKTKGIQAMIKVGNVDREITSLAEANHAWVLAEMVPGEWLALETTAGRIIYQDENPRYYRGWSFENPKKLKELIYGRPGPGE